MVSKISWEDEYRKETERAIQARFEGNEGLARVCARRAAGAVIGECLKRRGISELNNSAYNRLTIFNKLLDVDENCKKVARHFLIKVNTDHNLPVDIDLISDVTWLKNMLLQGKI